MSSTPRYRFENGKPCIDVSVSSIDRLFDNRDPAPFRQRDLDPGLVGYLVGASEDLASHRALRVVFWVEAPCAIEAVEVPYRAHFEYDLAQMVRRRRLQRRAGFVALAIAFVAIAALLSLGAFLGRFVPGWIGPALREALTISSWVLVWRPFDMLVYDWIPWRGERLARERLLAAEIAVRTGKPTP